MKLEDYVVVASVYGEAPPAIQAQVYDLLNNIKTSGELIVKNRTYHMKTYKNCFIAGQFITAIASRLSVDRSMATRVGIYIQNLGYIKHVCGEHYLKDEYLFFEFTDKKLEPIEVPLDIKFRKNFQIYVKAVNVFDLDATNNRKSLGLMQRRSLAAKLLDLKSIKLDPVVRPYCKMIVGGEVKTFYFNPGMNNLISFTVVQLPTICQVVILDAEKLATNNEDIIGHAVFDIETEGENIHTCCLRKKDLKSVGSISVTCEVVSDNWTDKTLSSSTGPLSESYQCLTPSQDTKALVDEITRLKSQLEEKEAQIQSFVHTMDTYLTRMKI
ncbi:deptor [Acrasis kona]|uniref:Deptor n=1 Tax=Acrasis kona TaxID=1008807 RepID=A0AAW2ZC80_9EUKA